MRSVVEQCWIDDAGLDRLADLVTPDYVHHTVFGDWDFERFRAGIDFVESMFTQRTYRVLHTVESGDRVAAYLEWEGTRRADRSGVIGRGAYHCRIAAGRIAEDWDVFFPTS